MDQQPQQAPPVAQYQDPFYGQFSGPSFLPPIPVGNNQSQMIAELLSDENVPEQKRADFWWVFSRDNSLTFLDLTRKQMKMMSFDIIKIDTMNSTPYYDFDFDHERDFTIMRNAFETKLDRSLGIQGEVKNERTVQQSQFMESRSFSASQNQDMQRQGWLGKIIGRR
jgi:hypothetical protein